MSTGDIFGVLTPRGPGGIAVVALCGPSAERVALSLFKGTEPVLSGASAGEFVIGEDVVDRCVLARTENDCYEFHLHASRVVVHALCEHLRQLGYREEALPDPYNEAEFLACSQTRREALLRALNTPRKLSQLCDLLLGYLSSGEYQAAVSQLAAVLRNSRLARWIETPPVVALSGPTNAGKSTLFNAIVGYDRVISSNEVGTTRDVVSDVFQLNGFAVELWDSPGSGAGDEWEKLAMPAAGERLSTADLTVHVYALDEYERPPVMPSAGIVVGNKSDIFEGSERTGFDVLVSARELTNLSSLLAVIADALGLPPQNQKVTGAIPIGRAFREHLRSAQAALRKDAVAQTITHVELARESLR